jgi:hypothetical protein
MRTIPIVGTVGDDGIKLKPEYEEEATPSNEEIAEAQRNAQVVATFLETGAPDFLMEAVLSAIDNAFAYTGLSRPTVPEGIADYDKDNLVPLFLETRLVSWGEMYADKDRVKDAIYTLLHNKATPADLYEAVAEFVCEQSNRAGTLQDNIFHSEPVLELLLNTVPADELQGATNREARQ